MASVARAEAAGGEGIEGTRRSRSWRFWLCLVTSVASAVAIAANVYAVSFDDRALLYALVVGLVLLGLLGGLGYKFKPPERIIELPLLVLPFAEWAAQRSLRSTATVVVAACLGFASWKFGAGSVSSFKMSCNGADALQSKVGAHAKQCAPGELLKIWTPGAFPEFECVWGSGAGMAAGEGGRRTLATRTKETIECNSPLVHTPPPLSPPPPAPEPNDDKGRGGGTGAGGGGGTGGRSGSQSPASGKGCCWHGTTTRCEGCDANCGNCKDDRQRRCAPCGS